MQTFNVEKTDSQCVVTWRHFSLDVIVLLAFFAFWTGMLGFMTCMVLAHQRFEILLFLLPFWAVAFGLFAWVANMLFGKTRFVLDKDGLETTWTCLSIRRERQFDLADIRRFETKVRHGNKGRRFYSLQIVLQSGNANFSAPAVESTFDDLCKQLNDFLHALKTGDAPDAAGVPAQWEMPEPTVFVLNSPVQHLDSPPKNRWQYQMDFNGFSFHFRENGKIATLFGAMGIAAFWNGIVSVFVLLLFGVIGNPPKDGQWWFVFFFLIPFVLIGLVLFCAALHSFLELFRRTSWRFTYGEAIFRTARLGPARVEHHELTRWDSLIVRVVRDEDEKEPEDEGSLREFYEDGKFWQVAFRDQSEADLAVIDGLYNAEALWLADVVLREQRAIR